jgi:hypothetical protein
MTSSPDMSDKKVFQDGTSDDAVLEQMGYTQGNPISKSADYTVSDN